MFEMVELVRNAKGGDVESFGELCRRHYVVMSATAFAILNDHQLAEDAAQEAFARAMVNLHKLKDDGRFAPWLRAICQNAARDMLRRKRTELNGDDLEIAADKPRDESDGEAVSRAVSKLPSNLKELVVMRYYDGLSYEQISDVLGISQASINGRLTRAKRKMAQYLNRCGIDGGRS